MDVAARRLVAVRRAGGAPLWAALTRWWDLGQAVLPLPHALPDAALAAALARLRPALLDDDGVHRPLPDPLPPDPDVALVLLTSGSTGEPKGVSLTAAALQASVSASLQRLEADGADRWLCCLPPTSIGGLQVLLRAHRLGHDPVIADRFDPSLLADPQVTMVSLVPTMLRRALDAGVDLSGLRRVLVGGAAADAGLLERARAGGARVVSTYGMTESAGGCVYDGTALDGVEVAVAPDGRITLAGPMLFSGYHGRADLTAAVLRDGVLRTEDLGRFDDDGRLVVVGRTDDILVSGGVNVPAAAVAALLAEHPAIREAAVVGVSDPEWGQRVVAVVEAVEAVPPLAELRAFVAERAPAPYAPRQLVAAALPRLANGKVDRLAVRRLVEGEDPGPRGYAVVVASPAAGEQRHE